MQFHCLLLTTLLFIFSLISENEAGHHSSANHGRSRFRPEKRGRSMGRAVDSDAGNNEVANFPVLPMDGEDPLPPGPQPKSSGSDTSVAAVPDVDETDKFSVVVNGKVKRLIFRLSNRLAVAVCDTYDNYLATGIPHDGPIKYNITIQEIRSKVDPTVCQSFKIKRCNAAELLPDSTNCGWTKVDTC